MSRGAECGVDEAFIMSPRSTVVGSYEGDQSCKKQRSNISQRMYGYIEKQDPLKLQAAAPRKLERLLKGVPASKLRKRPAAGKWSIAEIVAHIADAELVGGFRIRFILGSPGAPIQAFDQDVWVTALHYDKRDVRKAFEQYRALRGANLALLKTLTPEQLKQHGLHSERGPETVRRSWRCSPDTTSITSSRSSESSPRARNSRGFVRKTRPRLY